MPAFSISSTRLNMSCLHTPSSRASESGRTPPSHTARFGMHQRFNTTACSSTLALTQRVDMSTSPVTAYASLNLWAHVKPCCAEVKQGAWADQKRNSKCATRSTVRSRSRPLAVGKHCNLGKVRA